MNRRIEWTAIAVIVMASLAYHAATLRGQCFFIDELSELRIAREPIDQLLFKPDSMPPLYPLLNRVWLATWDSDDASRWLSVLFATAGVVAVWRFTRRLVDPPTGVASAAVLAASPLWLFYAQLVRGYALFGLLAVLSLGFFATATIDPSVSRRKAWSGFVVSSVLGMFTHYYFALLLASLLLIRLAATRGRIGREPLVAFATIAVAASPCLIFLQSDFGFQKNLRDARSMDAAAVGFTCFSFVSGYSLGPSLAELHSGSTREVLAAAAPSAITGLLFVVPVATEGYRRLARRRLAWSVLSIVALPILLTGLLGALAGITYNPRLVSWCVAPACVLMGAGAVGAKHSLTLRVATLGLAALAVTAVYQRHASPRYVNEDYRTVAAALTEAEGVTVYCVSDYITPAMKYYGRGLQLNFVELPNPGEQSRVIKTEEQAEQAIAIVDSGLDRDARLVYSRAFHGDPESLLLDRLIRENRVELEAVFAGATLYRLLPAQPDDDASSDDDDAGGD